MCQFLKSFFLNQLCYLLILVDSLLSEVRSFGFFLNLYFPRVEMLCKLSPLQSNPVMSQIYLIVICVVYYHKSLKTKSTRFLQNILISPNLLIYIKKIQNIAKLSLNLIQFNWGWVCPPTRPPTQPTEK